MTEPKPHSDNALIDELEDQGGAPDQGGRSGGNVARDVGTRAEIHRTVRDTGMERPTGQSNPAEDAMKGAKTIARLDPAERGPEGR